MIRNIVFDMGQVLLPFDGAEHAARYTENAADAALLYREVFCSIEWLQLDRGSITEAEAARAMCARLPGRLHPNVHTVFDRWHKDSVCDEDMSRLAGELGDAGYGLYLLSNTCRRFHEFRTVMPILDRFNGILISSDVLLCKPDPAIYRLLYKRFSLNPAECFFVDDSRMNIEAALFTGMRGFAFEGDVGALRRALVREGVSVRTEG